MTPSVIDNRYRFVRPLGRGGMGEVACVFDRLTATQVALKRVRLDAEGTTELHIRARALGQESTAFFPTRAMLQSDTILSPPVTVKGTPERDTLRLSLAQEFRTLASLRHPHIISVLDYGFDDDLRPFFTMELIRDARPLVATQGLSLSHKLELLGQLLSALNYLHRRGVLHRDLKPSNVVVAKDGDRDCLKVLDFGLALGRKDRLRMRAEVAGTLGYIAPEVLLGESPSEVSDLYAVGVIAYEVLTEQPPFEPVDDERMLHRLLDPERQPDFAPLSELGDVCAVVRRLMERAPSERFASAAAALSALEAAAGRSFHSESAVVRESYLQSAPLTGRDREWSELQGYVDRLMEGTGAGLLIAGESGVGKSRLLEELRTYALVHGARVVNGQSVSGGGAAYHVFQDAIRLLCLSVPLTDAQGAILKALASDLPRLLERSLPDAPLIDAQAAQSRLHNTLEALLRELDVPIVIILEDLQWADTESLALLRRILTVAQTRPLLIAGTFRDDERPRLPEELPGTVVLKLNRLPSTQIADLCLSMLGTFPRPELLEFMVRETEGNAFFIVEIMRALAEEAGGLGAVGGRTLPPQVLTGGIRTILQRRIERVPPNFRGTLRLMAVAGRQLDLEVLRQFEPRYEMWLATCADAAVLEISEQRWRFAHDKLREALLAELDGSEWRRLHQQVAAAIEKAYRDPEKQATALAYHYREAGLEKQAAHYGIIAGEQALAQGALAEAVSLLQQVVPVLDKHPDAELLAWARAHRLLAQALFGLHEANECVRISEKGLKRLHPERWSASSSAQQTLSMLSLVGEHALHQAVASSVRLVTDEKQRALLHEQLLMILAAGEMYAYLGQPVALLRAILGGIELARALDDVPNQAFTTSVAAFLLEFTPLRALARSYLQQAQGLVGRTQNPLAEAQVCRIGGIVYQNNGQVERGTAMIVRGAELFRSLGDDFMQLFSLAQAGIGFMLMGLTSEGDAVFADMGNIALRGRHPYSYLNKQAWAGLFAARRGQEHAVRRELLDASASMNRGVDPLVTAAVTTGVIASSLRAGELGDARNFSEQALDQIPASPTGFNYFVALSAVLDAYLTIWEGSPSGLDARDSASLTRALSLLRPYSAALRLSRAHASWLESRLFVLRGQLPLAQRKAATALALALEMRLPYEEGLAHEQLGRIAIADGAGAGYAKPLFSRGQRAQLASEHLSRAATLLHRFGDHTRAKSVERLLGTV